MSNLLYEPTKENIFKTFKEDKIDRNEDVYLFIELLNSIDSNYSIALDGQWGSGKTFFVKQTVMILDALYDSSAPEYQDKYEIIKTIIQPRFDEVALKNFPIYFDAWENDNDDDPLLSLIYTIIEKYGENLPNVRNATDILFDIASVVTSSPIVQILTKGLLGSDTVEKIEELKNSIVGEDLLADIKNAKDIESKIHNFFDILVKNKESERIVIFIDELDRCKPSYAVKLLERIKHYMTHEKITFVFSTNLTELSHTIKQCYGNEFDGYAYLEKFFIEIQRLEALTSQQIETLYQLDASYSIQDNLVKQFIRQNNIAIRTGLKISIRVKKFVASSYYTPYGNQNFTAFSNYLFVPYLICLQLYNDKQYRDFINGKSIASLSSLLNHVNESFLKDALFTPNEIDFTTDTLLDRFTKLYINIFGQENDDNNNSHNNKVGNTNIPRNAKNQILAKLNKIK